MSSLSCGASPTRKLLLPSPAFREESKLGRWWQLLLSSSSCPRASKGLLSFLHNHKLVLPSLEAGWDAGGPRKWGTNVSAAGARSYSLTLGEDLWRKRFRATVHPPGKGEHRLPCALGRLWPESQSCTKKSKRHKIKFLWSIIICTILRRRPH